MIYLRSALYNLCFYPMTIAVGLCLPVLYFLPIQATLAVSRLWVRGVYFFLRVCCGLTYEVRGMENLPPHHAPAIFACKHQSAWETMIFMLLYPKAHPAYVLKRELLRLPFFGQFVRRLDMIPINRRAGNEALHTMVEGARRILGDGRSIVIFPEGTRTKVGAKPTYKKRGVTALYQELPDVPLIPVALNSGCFWKRHDWKKRPGHIVMQILPPIPAGLGGDAFMTELQERIETSTNALVEEARARGLRTY